MKTKDLPYVDALDFFNSFDLSEQAFAFLLSSVKQSYSGKYSVLALLPKKVITCDTFVDFKGEVTLHEHSSDYFAGGYFGYLSYDLKNEFEQLPSDEMKTLSHPNILFYQFKVIYYFDESVQQLKVYYHNEDDFIEIDNLKRNQAEAYQEIRVESLESNFDKQDYLDAINTVKDYIIAGDIFEANLTRKFYGNFETKINSQGVFNQLIKKSPSQYSAFLKFDDLEIMSTSPERFLKIKDNRVSSKPIKGTRPRGANNHEDEELIEDLKHSEKDRAENLMIVDLVRNDLGRIAEIGSVHVPDLFKIESYETVHQLVSTIEAKIDQHYSCFDVIQSAFPPGSMTGAPKIRAMEICTELEKLNRGIYSGALGYIGEDGYVDLSVVIRTLIIKNKQFEFQVGGAIVADSDPEQEYQETLDKSKAIANVLNLNLK